MTIDTNLNQDPYYDDYDFTKDFHRILFKPAVAVQAREMNQLQTILQNQIEQFGDNIFYAGTIIKGCNFTFINALPYVKILDLDTSNVDVIMENYTGLRAVGLSTGVEAYVVTVSTGLQSQTPALNTLHLRYLNSSGANKTFSTTENIRLENFSTGATIATVTAAGTVAGESVTAIGTGVGLKVADGIIYQKGAFIRVAEQLVVVEKYSTTPNAVAVGFATNEQLITSTADTTLLDNAAGFNNENAPGADRLKLTPTLEVKTVVAADADEDFFTLIEYANGNAVRRKETTQYSIIGEEFARRTAEESGDYVVNKFPLSVEVGDNANSLNLRVGSGTAYVGGNRVKTFAPVETVIDISGDFASVTQQNITTNIGHYVIVDEFYGDMKFDNLETVNLHDESQTAATANTVVTPASANGSLIGTAKIRGIEYHSGSIGQPACQYRLYLFDIRMANTAVTFEDTKSIVYDGTRDGSGDIVLDGTVAKIKDFSFKKSLWPIGKSGIKTVPAATADFTYTTYTTTTIAGGTGSISAPAGGVFPYSDVVLSSVQKQDLLIVDANGLPTNLDSVTVTISGSGTTMSFASFPVNGTAAITYRVKRTAAQAKTKDTKTVYVKVDSSTNVGGNTGSYSLGLPDAYELVGVWEGSNNSVSESDTEVTSNFRLYPNQRDAFYDLSYVKKDRSYTIAGSEWFLFKVNVFQESGSGKGYASADSYVNLPSAPITYQTIPTYTSESGIVYDLRDTLDFRPQCSNTVVYATTAGAATTVTTAIGATPTFAAAEAYTPTPNENAEIDYDYYQGRIDRLIVDNIGQFKVLTGTASDNPTQPSEPSKGLKLATITIPPYPALTPLVAARANKESYGVKVKPNTNNKVYTMEAIGSLDRRITNLEYYTTLNALESAAKDKAIVDVNGLDRFKNGIFVDSFTDLYSADVKNSEFNASIDPTFHEVQPKFRQFDVNLKVANVSSVTNFGKLATLSKTDVSFINQPYATKTRNPVQDFYQYNGTMFIFPEYDAGFDVTTAPDFNIDIDLTTPFIEFTEALNEFVPLQRASSSTRNRTTSQGDLNTRTSTTTTTTTKLDVTSSETETNVGEFVSDIQFNPFMASREINILVHGMRPSTTYYFFFDGQAAAADVASAVAIDGNADDVVNFRRSSTFGSAITSDTTGTVRAIYRIPSETFFVGDRRLEIMDVSTYAERNTAISVATRTYSAFNYSVEKTGLGINVRRPEFASSTSTTARTTVTRWSDPPAPVQNWQDGADQSDDGGDDPIAQTFFVKSEMAGTDNVLYATKIDLYFKEKSATAGFTLELREVESGVITKNVLPFSTVHVNANTVNANTTAAQATTVTFEGPIPLEVGKEYAFLVKPDGNDPDYRIWIAKTGETDVLNNIAITQDANDGTLFTSTNARTWTPYQDENIKYTLYRANFSAASGTVTFTNKDSEYFTMNTVVGTFKSGEYVFKEAANNSGTLSITAGNTTILGTTTDFSGEYTVGEFIVVKANNTVFDVLEIKTITSNTEIIVYDPPKYTNTASNHFKSIVGKVASFDNTAPVILHLDHSSAISSDYFAALDALTGAESGATGTIQSVDNKNVSFLAPNIYKTNTTQTKTSLTAGVPGSLQNMAFNNFTYLNSTATTIKSRSNELADSDADRSFAFQVTMENTSGSTPRYSSPVIDVDVASVKMFEYIVNNDNTDEDTTDGASESKYVSRIINLADTLDAEDLKVYLTAYQPINTTIEVYAKFLSASDAEDFVSKPWTKLTGQASNPFSQNVNRYDFKEHEFNIPATTAPVTGAAFLNSSGTFEYTSTAGTFNNYKYFAIKVVLLGAAHNVVPRLSDIRAIALSV